MDTTKEIEEIKKRLTALESAILGPNREKSGSKKSPRLSLSEFLGAKKLNNDVQTTLSIGYFLQRHSNMDSFNVVDLMSGFERAKRKKPLNINDKVNMNIRNGFMEEASAKKDNKKSFYVTVSGEKAVENNFQESK